MARDTLTFRILRWLLLVALAGVALQLFFVGRIALMAVVDPSSTTFERSEAWRIVTEKGALRWRQQWVPYAQISDHLKRAVIASEDGDFINHDGVEWEAIEKAWQKNTQAEELAAKRAARTPPGNPPRRRRPRRSSAAPPSPSSSPRTCCCRASAPCCARARNSC
jgi:monofunctional biosynthetic peptidoglycan transglycosylase